MMEFTNFYVNAVEKNKAFTLQTIEGMLLYTWELYVGLFSSENYFYSFLMKNY